MSCTIDSKVLRNVLQTALRTNPEKYRNLENSIRDILKVNNLTDEAKIKIIAAYNEVYKHLASKSTVFDLNKLDTFIDAKINPLINDTTLDAERFTQALSLLRDKMSVEVPKDTTQNLRAKELAIQLSEAIESPVVGRYARIRSVLDMILKERSLLDAGIMDEAELNSAKIIENALAKLDSANLDSRRLSEYRRMFNDTLAELRTPQDEQSYVDLRSIGEFGSDRYEAYLEDGTVVDLIKKENEFYYADEALQITDNLYDTATNPAPRRITPQSNRRLTNDASTVVLDADELRSGLVLVGPNQEAFEQEIASSSASPLNSITIIADTTRAERNRRRLGIIKSNSAKYPGLENRTLETMEAPAQIKRLQQGKPVLTKARMTDGFSIRLVSPSGQEMTLMEYNNYVVVYPDNTTRLLDLENEEDLELFAALTNVRGYFGGKELSTRPTTLGDLQVIRDGARRSKEFRKEVQALLDKGETVIPTELFAKYFEFNNVVYNVDFSESVNHRDRIKDKRLDDFMARHNAGVTVSVINENDPGNVMERRLPLIFAPVSRRSGSMWAPVELLGQGEFVVVDGKRYKWREYVNAFHAPKGSKILDSLSKLKAAHHYAMVIPSAGGINAIAPLVRMKSPTDSATKAKGMLSLFGYMDGFTPGASTSAYTKRFNNNVFGFDVVRYLQPDFFTNQTKGGESFLGIQFTATGSHPDEEFFNENKDLVRFAIDKKPIDAAVQAVKDFFAAEDLDLDLDSQEGIEDMFNQLDALFSNPAASESVKNLQETLDKLYEKFTKKVYKQFEAKIDSLLNHEDANTRMMAERMMENKENFLQLMFDTRDRAQEMMMNDRSAASSNLSTYYTIKANYKTRLSMQYNLVHPLEVLNNETAIDDTLPIIVNDMDTSSALSKNKTAEPGSSQASDVGDFDEDMDDFDPFGGAASLGNALERAVFEAGEFQRQVDYIRERLPEGISIDDLNKIVRHLDADGNVLGYIKDKVIYLSEQLSRPGTPFHEAFHAVFRYLMTPQERADLLSREYEKMGTVSEAQIAEFRRQRRFTGHLSNTQVLELMAEERLADKFQRYATKKTRPETWYSKLFNLIEKLIKFFTSNKNDIEKTFDRIHSGFYKNAAVKEFSGVEGAYQLIKTVPTFGLINGKPTRFYESMNAQDMMNLRNIMVAEMLTSKTAAGMNASERYDKIAEQMVSYYDIQNLVSQSPGLEKQILEKYDIAYRDMRYVLGGMNKGEKFSILNITGDPTYDNKFISSESNEVYTKNAQESYRQMKQMVLEVYNNLNIVSTVEDAAATDQINDESPEQGNTDTVNTALNSVEETGSKDPDISLLETGTSEGDREFRKIFQFLTYEHVDPRLGIKMKKAVNADRLFDTVKKITVNTPKDQILSKIQTVIDRLEQDLEDMMRLSSRAGLFPVEYDNVSELSMSLKAMMEMLNKTCGIENGIPTRSEAMFNQFHRVFYVATGEITQVNIRTTRSRNNNEELQYDSQMSSVDMVQNQDNWSAFNKIVENYNTNYVTLSQEEKDEIQDELAQVRNNILDGKTKNVSQFYLENGQFSDAKVKEAADDLYVVSAKAGLGIPRHFFHFSLGAMILDSGYKMPRTSETFELIKANREIYSQKGYMDGYMLASLRQMLSYKNSSLPLFENDAESKSIKSNFLPSMTYLTRYDSTIGQPVVRNTTGNKIYRFTLYSPNMQAVQDVQTKGLDKFVKQVYGPEFMDFFNDNPYFAEEDMGQLFLDYLSVGYLGGVSQRIDGRSPIATDISSIDKTGYHLANFALFNDRKTFFRGSKMLTTFKRITSQNDSTGTVFHVTGRYEKYVNNSVDMRVARGNKKVTLVSSRLADLVQQEYNRIAREWSERESSKKRYIGYNALIKNGKVKTDTASLRAYNFQQLDTFFLNELDSTDPKTKDKNVAERIGLRKALINAATSGKTFEEAVALPEMANLYSQLDSYANDEFDFFIDNLVSNKIVNRSATNELSTDYFNDDMRVDGKNTASEFKNLSQSLKDYFYNDWINRLMVNQLFDGDRAVGVKSAVDYYKRLKSQAAAGPNAQSASWLLKHGDQSYRHAVFSIMSEKGAKEVKVYFDQDDLTKPQSHRKDGMTNPTEFDIMDGHVHQRLTHRMHFLNAEGKLDAKSEAIIRSLRYKRLSFEEIKYLESRGIQLNPQKTVTAHPIHYLKMSEHYINRFDVSYYKGATQAERRAARERVAELYKLADLYEGQLDLGVEVNENNESIEQLYRDTIQKIHSEFVAHPGREMLHNLLNNMEYHRLGQALDVSASKRGTIVPTIINLEDMENPNGGYWDMENSVATIPMNYVYNQVVTEAHHHDVTDSIQPKLLIDTDLDLNDPKVPEDLKTLVREYRRLLADMSATSREKFQRMIIKEGEVDVASFFKIVQESLQKQGAPQHMLKKWDVVDGQPVHSTNLTGIADALKYYVFSMANSVMFQPKAPGYKFFHASSFGYKVIVDENDNVVPDEEIRKDPSKYAGYNTRYPSFRKTTNENGVEEYYVEVLIPRPTSTNTKKLRIIEKSLEEFFGTRIPTEDKRSMVRVKVVGYLDASFINTIVVPEQVHHLSGSDKDIDALYTRMQGTYDNVLNEMNIYGDYSEYINRYGLDEKTAKFVEYLHYMMDDPFYGPLVNKEIRRMREDTEYKVENLRESSAMFGPKIQAVFNRSFDEVIKDMKSNFSKLKLEGKIKESAGKSFSSFEDLRDAMETQGDENSYELARQCRLLEKLTAVINVLQDSSMPMTADELDTYEKTHGSPVIPKLQNQITNVMNKILGHQHVYKNLYSKESSNADIYKNAVDKLGRDEKDTIGQSNNATITSVANVRDSNKSAKRGIEIFAAFNKGLSIAVKHGLSLSEPLWNINGKVYDNFNENRTDPSAERAHALIGNSLGMSADAAKSPYPAVLSLNQYNMGVTATMLSLGIDPYLAIYINLMPSVKNVLDQYASDAEGSVRKNMKRTMGLSAYLDNKLKHTVNKMRKSKDETEKSFGYNFDLSDYEFSFDVNNVQPEVVNGENPTIESLGLTITHKKGIPLTESMKDAIILGMFTKQYEHAEAIRFELTPLTDGQKSLAPDFNNIDRLLEVYRKDRSKSVFNGYKNIFAESPVYNMLIKSVELIDELTQKLFLVRRPMVKELTSLLNRAIYEATPEGVAGNINSIFAMEALKNMVDKAMSDPELETKSPVMYARYKSFQEMLKADYWYNNDMVSVVNSLKRQFPGNAFLNAVVEFKGKQNIRVIRSMSKAKVSTDLETMIMNGLDQLLMNPDGEVRHKAYQLFYYSIVKDGLGKAAYSLRSYLNPDNFREISNELKKVEKAFEELDKFGKTTLKVEEYSKKFNAVFKDVFGEKNTMNNMIESILNKVVAVYETEAKETNVHVINYTGNGKFKNAGADAVRDLIAQLRPGMAEEVIKEAYTGKDSKGRRRKFVKPIGTVKEKQETEESKDIRSDNDLFLPDATGRVELDLSFKASSPEQDELLDDVAAHVKIFPRRGNAEGAKNFNFPLYVTNTYGDLLMLESINGVSVNDKIASHVFNKVNASAEEVEMGSAPFVGNKATYKVVSRMGNEHVSPIAFSAEEAIKLHDFAAGTEKPTVKIEKAETSINDNVIRYKGIEVKYDSDLKREGTNEPGGAKYLRGNNTIILNREMLYQKYLEKAWTNPLKQRDNTFSTALPEDFFQSYEEWESFVMEHERQHAVLGTKKLYEDYGAYEDRVNRAALGELFPGRDISFLGSEPTTPANPAQTDVQKEMKTVQSVITTKETPLQIFVDGSDIKGTGKLGYGAAVEHGGKMYKLSGTEETQAFKSFQALFPDAKFSNPTMEMLGLVMTLNNFRNKSEHIVINQDYKGAVNYGALWMRSEGSAQREKKPWNAKEAYIKYLVGKAEEMIEQIERNGGSVKLNWVKGHAGNRMNDAADEAAKNRGQFNEFTQLFDSSSVDKVIESKEEQSKDCNKGNN